MAEVPVAPVAPITTVITGTAPWYQGVAGVDQEMIGHWTNKGWQNKTASEVAVEATKAYKEAEHFVGVPAEQIVRLPKDASDEKGWDGVWKRLGKPTDAKEYDFSAIKMSDGTALDENFANAAREWAFKNNLPKTTAAALTQEFAKFMDGAKIAERTEQQAKLVEEQTALAKNWGANAEANKFIAQRAAATLGVKPEEVAAAEKMIGYSRVMEMFRNIGTKIGEAKFITGSGTGDSTVMTKDSAVARKADLMQDKIWVAKYLQKDAAAVREMTALNTLIVGTGG